MKKLLLLIFLSLLITIVPISSSLAATSQDVTVTGTPSFIAITNSPATWTINGITGNSKIKPSFTYYTNPLGDTVVPSAAVVDGECQFTMGNTSNVITDITVNFSNFTGGDALINTNLGTSNTTAFGAYSWYSGMTYSGKVIAKSSSSSILKDSLAASTSLKWGVEIRTQTNAWVSPTAMTSTITISAAEH